MTLNYAALVRIKSRNPENDQKGTGFVFHHDEQGTYVMTCQHVVEQGCNGAARNPLVDGCESSVICEGNPDECDLAILHCDAPQLKTKPPLRLSRIDLPQDVL